MALLFVDGCDCYAATADITKRWTTNSNTTNITYDATGGKQGTGSIKLAAAGNLQRMITQGTTKTRLGLWWKATTKPSSNGTGFSFLNSGLTQFGGLIVLTSGALQGFNWYTSNTDTTATGLKDVCDGHWPWIEWESIHHNSTGVLKVWIDGVLDINFTGDNYFTGTVDYNTFRISGLAGMTAWIDDIVLWDDTGTELTGQIGAHVIETLRPTADTAQKDFTRSAGSDNYALVDEAAPNDDADYVYSTTVGHEDLYDVGNLSAGVTSVKAVCSVIVAKNDQGGSINLKHSAKSSSTTGRSAAQAVPSAYAPMFYAFAKNPATAAAWTPSEVNSAQFGFQVA